MKPFKLAVDSKRKIEILRPEKCHPARPLIILGHGAGQGMISPFLDILCHYLAHLDVNTVRFNFPYMVSGRKIPDSPKTLQKSWHTVIDWVTQNLSYLTLFIGGKSMGGRIASLVAREISNLQGLVFLGYPLHTAGKFQKLRDEHLYGLQLPMLFFQGSRDPLARLDLLHAVIKRLANQAKLVVIEDGDHSLRPPPKSGRTHEEVLQHVAAIIARWMNEVSK